MHHFVGADGSCISWGHAQYGELGYGPMGQKYVSIFSLVFLKFPFNSFSLTIMFFFRSSATPKKVEILEGMHVIG